MNTYDQELLMAQQLNRVLFLVIGLTLAGFTQETNVLKIGDGAPETNRGITDTSGRTTTLAEAAKTNGLLVIFSCNTCPWVAKWEDRYSQISSVASSKNVGMIVLNPNERIRNRGESMEDMRKRAQKQGYNFTYALDKDHVIADAFGATRTPEVFLFNGQMKLVYHGAIDDNADDPSSVDHRYTEQALNAIGNGTNIETAKTKFDGCTIKRTE